MKGNVKKWALRSDCKGFFKTLFGGGMAVVLLSMIMSFGVLAAKSVNTSGAQLSAENTDIANSKWAYRAVADVMTQVNIRAQASTESAVVGYLPKAAVAGVLDRGEEWSHIISGEVEGYIKNEFLAFGKDAKALADVYGMPGVETYWDGVNVFAEPKATAKIVETVNGSKEFRVIEKKGAWILIQVNSNRTAYIPAEDVKETTILERAIPIVTSLGSTSASTSAGYTVPSSQTSNTSNAQQNTWTQDTPASTPENTSGNTSDNVSVETSSNTENTVTEATVTTADADELSLLAALIYCEAGNQPREGKVAVGAVVLNRVASASFASTIKGVIYQSGQFTPAYSGALSRALANGVPSNCHEAAQAALNGENPVPGALYFNTVARRGVQIGAHWFY